TAAFTMRLHVRHDVFAALHGRVAKGAVDIQEAFPALVRPVDAGDLNVLARQGGQRVDVALVDGPRIRVQVLRGPLGQAGVGVAHFAVCPPSTGIVTPVTNPASSLARNATTPAISAGVAGRPNGTNVMKFAIRSETLAPGSRPKNVGSIGVSTG